MQTFTISDLSFTYPTETVPALQNVSLSIEAGSFTVLCGRSGCGKSTLLRQLKPILQPHGTKTGEILFEGKPLESLSQREQSARIGFVLQNLDAQLVTDKVWHELAFGPGVSGTGHADDPPPRGGNCVVFRHPELVL